MLHGSKVLAIAALLSAGTACDSGRHTTTGFSLPADGNTDRGRQAFVELGCHSCHAVRGVDLPRPTVEPPVPVILGGDVDRKLSDAYIVTAMINPSYQLAPYSKDQIASGGVSRMPAYSDKMTVRQAIDVVAFLQSHYAVRPALPTYTYH